MFSTQPLRPESLTSLVYNFFFLIFRLHGGLEPLVDLIKDSEEKTENKKLLAAVTGHYEAIFFRKLQPVYFTRYFLIFNLQ